MFMFKKSAFTMAEILLSLTIIGVVAAITLPSLMGNINERTWNTQRRAFHARLSQAVAMMPQLNGYGTYAADAEGNVTDTATEALLTEGLSKVLKINNICDNEHFADCGINGSFVDRSNFTHSSFPKTLYGLQPELALTAVAKNTKAAAFETQNGESVVAYYNPECINLNDDVSNTYVSRHACISFLYDLNGTKGPNTIGKDMGIGTVFYPTDSVVVMPDLGYFGTGDDKDPDYMDWQTAIVDYIPSIRYL